MGKESLHGVFFALLISRLFYRRASHPVDNDWNDYRTVLGFASLNNYSDAGIFVLRAVFICFFFFFSYETWDKWQAINFALLVVVGMSIMLVQFLFFLIGHQFLD